MGENNEKNLAKNNSSKKQSNKVNKKSLFSEYKSEFKKITWPTRNILIKQTITVIIISLVVGAIIFAYDFSIGYVFEKIAELIA